MTDRETITEVIAETTLRVEVPIDRGGELAAGAQDVLESLAVVRYADVRELLDVDAGDEGLSVTVDCHLTIHVDDSSADAPTIRRTLCDLSRVVEVKRFEAVDGPYRIERW